MLLHKHVSLITVLGEVSLNGDQKKESGLAQHGVSSLDRMRAGQTHRETNFLYRWLRDNTGTALIAGVGVGLALAVGVLALLAWQLPRWLNEGPWTLILAVTAAPDVWITWFLRNEHKEQDLAQRDQDLRHERERLDQGKSQALTERFVRGAELLGASPTTRIGGIYALQQLALDSSVEAGLVAETLAGFVRHRLADGFDERRASAATPERRHQTTLLAENVKATRADPLFAQAVGLDRDSPDRQTLIEAPDRPASRPGHDVLAALRALGRLSAVVKGRIDLSGLDGRTCDLSYIELLNCNLQRAQLRDAHFTAAHLPDVDFSFCDLTMAHLSGALLPRAGFFMAIGEFCRLQGADLRGASFRDFKGQHANLERADLTDADLSHAVLQGADLQGATLVRAVLRNADLRVANLKGTKLAGANLHGADLHGANLYGADLTGATGLEKANWSLDTTWPEGFKPPGSASDVATPVDDAVVTST